MDFPKFYKKAIKGSVGGRRLNKKGDEVEFLLKGDPNDPNIETTVEIFDADGDKFFRKTNKSAISNGYLIEVSESTLSLDETNAVSDGFLRDLLKQPFTKMKKRVDAFTSSVPVARLLEIARSENKPVKTVEYLVSTLQKLESFGVSTKINLDGVKVTTI